MNNMAVKLLSVLLLLLFPYTIYGQQAEAPVYEDGDWWRVKIEFDFKYGFSRSGECYEDYPEYLVKIEQGKPKVYGISGTVQEEIDCPQMADEVLGRGRSKRLEFPLSLGLTWTGRGIRIEHDEMTTGQFRGTVLEYDFDTDHKVLAWEKVETPKGAFDAFKIREWRYETYGITYYYSPKVKAIVLQIADLEDVDRKVALVDFSLVSGRKDLEGPLLAKKPLGTQQIAKPQKDTLPPQIVITSHDTTKALQVKPEQSRLTIRGQVADLSGVAEVTVNGRSAVLDAAGNFQADILLKVGDNPIVVSAIDIHANVAEQTFTFHRSAGKVASPSQVAKIRQDILPLVPKREGKRFAVLIGIGDYQDTSILDLAYATADAKSVYDLLTDPARGGFPRENVKLLLGRKATRRSIVDAIGDWLFRRAGPEDEVFVYYAGHGAVETDRTGTEPDGLAKYLVPADAVPQKLFVTGIPNSELARMFQALKTKRLVFFLDSCYSAGTTGLGRALTLSGFRAGSLSEELYGRLAGTGQAIVAAAKPNQVALELPKLGHGLFTKFVLDGLQGSADTNGDGYVTLLELYPYLSREVSQVARQEGGIQEPVLRSSIAGDIVLASVPETLQKLSIEARVERLKKHYTDGTISPEQLKKAIQILESGQRNRMLEDFFKGEIPLSIFRRLF